MKIVRILGGLGNQMFQYAFLVALRETFKQEILMDTSLFSTYLLHQGFELERLFQISARSATKEEIQQLVRYTRHYNLYRIYAKLLPPCPTELREDYRISYNERLLTDPSDLYYDGIWQDYRYFNRYRSFILKEFRLKVPMDEKNQQQLNVFTQPCHVSIHVRRGDYLKHKNYRGLSGLDYYYKAIEYVKNKYTNPVFVIFSNDLLWCQKHILPLTNNGICVDWNTGADSYKDMLLMSACQVNIIANSSFSWWAAYLNEHPDKEVIAPEKWTNSSVAYQRQMPDWTLF